MGRASALSAQVLLDLRSLPGREDSVRGGNLPQILELYEDCDLSDRRKLAEANANL